MTGEFLVYLVPVLLLVGLLVLGFIILNRADRHDGGDSATTGGILNRDQLACWHALQEAVEETWVIFPKVGAAVVFKPQAGVTEVRALLKRHPSGCLDFVLCDRESSRAVLLIQLEPRRGRRSAASQLLAAACQTTEIPLLRIERAKQYDPGELAEQIEQQIGSDEEEA